MFIGINLAMALAVMPMQDPPQERPASPPAATANQEPDRLEDVEIIGRPLETLIRNFVGEVAEPNRDRGLARWDDSICVGVVNLRADLGQYIVDRVSTVAQDLGLRTGEPGCNANILVVATEDGGAVARSLVDNDRRVFRPGGSGMDRGGDALENFIEEDRPVRWWQLAVPVNSETGQRAVRIPGECAGTCTSLNDFAPVISGFAASRLRTQIVDNLTRTIVIVDIDEVEGLTSLQLADYIAMVSLAQIDPDADTSAYATILNVVADPQGTDSLTDWDLAYLDGLYAAERNQVNTRANRSRIVSSIRRSHAELQAEKDETPEEP